jgi:hypothetical protein
MNEEEYARHLKEAKADYSKRFSDAKARYRMLECQFVGSNECNKCRKRFKCHTIRAKRFRLTESGTSWNVYEVFAENKDEAEEIFSTFGHDLCRHIKSDGADWDIDTEEWEK